MKKIFLFAAAIAAMTVNAKVITFGGIVDKESEASAISSFSAAFDLENITVSAAENGDHTAWYAEVKQTNATTEWDVTTMTLNTDDQVYLTFKDGNDNKLVMKAYNEYVQPNGKAACLVITGLSSGDKVKLVLNKVLNKETLIEGATVASDMFNATEIELTAADDEMRIYSKSVDGTQDAKWQIVSVEVPGASQAVENTNAAVKAEKFFRNGQLIIRKNGVEYNALGAQL